MDLHIVILICSLLLLLLVFNKKEHYQTSRLNLVPDTNTPNPWDQTARIMYSMQLDQNCKDKFNAYLSNPTEENYANLLSCKTNPAEKVYIKQLLTTLQSGVM
jgi:hypothetical protein